MSESSGEKKHLPTERRRQRAREEGCVARSADLSSAVLLLAALAALWLFGGHAAEHLAGAITEGLANIQVGHFSAEDANDTLVRGVGRMGVAVLPMMIAMMVIGVLVNVSQTGFRMTPAKVAPSLKNISPVTGLKRIGSLSGIARLSFGIAKVSIVLLVAYAAVRHHGQRITNLAGLEIPQVARTLFDCLLGTCLWIGGALFVLALADYGFQIWKHNRDLMMTDEELREELRETEGDPAIANRRKQIQQSRPYPSNGSQSTGGQSTGGAGQGTHPAAAANLIITAPTGVAVALRYDPTTLAAPVVVAKGTGHEADRIRAIAKESQIRQSSQPLLAQHQFRSVAVGTPIPPDQYVLVANLMRT